MFAGLWPGFDPAEVPIGSVTNGVHVPDLGGPRDVRPRRPSVRHRGRDAAGWAGPSTVADAELWALRRSCATQLVDDARAPAARSPG